MLKRVHRGSLSTSTHGSFGYGAVAAHAVLTIDLAAIVANWRLLQKKHVSGPVGAVLKADGYGLGARPIATALAGAGCRHFFVATLDEALSLRPYIPDAALVVLGGLFPAAEREYAAHDMIPALGSLAEIDAWSRHHGNRCTLPAGY